MHRFRRLFILIALFAVLVGSFTYVLHEQASRGREQEQTVIRRYEMLRQVRLVLMNAVNMETGVRGFFLSGNKGFLDPYNVGLERSGDAFVKLRALAQDEDAEFRQQVDTLGTLVDQESGLLGAQLKKFGKAHGAAYPLTVNDMWAGKDALDKIRSLTDDILRDQNLRLNTGISLWHDQQQRYTWILFSGALAMLIGVIVASYALMGAGERAQKSEADLRHFEEGYQLLLAGMNDGTYDWQPDTQSLYLSPSHERLLGYAPGELPTNMEQFRKICHAEDLKVAIAAAEAYMRREVPDYSQIYRMRHKNGDWRWILSRGVGAWDADGAFKRLVGIHTDITAQKAREEELTQLNGELESFTYIASHDLRGPLINIKGFAGEVDYTLRQVQPQLDRLAGTMAPAEKTAFEQAINSDIPEALGFIRAAVDKMDKLTTAILDLSRIGRRDYKSVPLDTAAVVQTSLKALAFEIGQKGITIEIGNLPPVVTDEVALEQVFGNLLDNAVKYMDPARPGTIRISSESGTGEHVFAVADNGTGISAVDHKKVFDIFRRGANARDTRGIGMGMSYVKTTLRKLGGRVWFDSTPGVGTTFYFTIPYDALARQPDAA